MPPSTTLPEPVRLPERDAQLVLLVRAFEEADGGRDLLTRAERRRASAEASQDGQALGAFLTARARRLEPALRRESGSLFPLLTRLRLRGALPWVLALCLVLGLLSNQLGPGRSINVVANPLAGLIAWNLGIYLVLLVTAVWGVLGATRSGTTSYPVVGRLLSLATARWKRRVGAELEGAEGRVLATAVGAFLRHWNRVAGPLLLQRLRVTLHLAASAMVLGALLGMYARGLLFEYLATWESTFLGPDQVARWLEFLLGPAAAISGIELPDVRAIERAPDNAAPWIHLYALTTALVVFVPRTLLALWAGRRASTLAGALPLEVDEPYYQRLALSGTGGDVARTRVLPYSYTLSADRAAATKALLADLLGARAEVELDDPTPYGEDPAPLVAGSPEEGELLVLLFNLAQTPESEVHGHLVELLRAHVRGGGRGLVLVDGSRWKERATAGETHERRRMEKRRTWDRVLREAGFQAAHLDLDGVPDDEDLAQLEAGLQPARDLGVAG